ncbi:transposase, IS4 family domain protein [Vibrio parahaemolyticus VPTS-2010_2]|nr:transposase, IS4 family domain protein [Vibrio parahaemolyticus VPTS-2010_2]
MEGAYRFIRNEQIKTEVIAEAGFYVTVQETLEQQTSGSETRMASNRV